MNVSWAIARRYLFSKGNRNVINLISGIAASGVAVGSLAMIIVLSAFNGLESLVSELYMAVDPDIRISPVKGKVFDPDMAHLDSIASWPQVHALAPVLEETVFMQFDGAQAIVSLRGIPLSYLNTLLLDSFLIEGQNSLEIDGYPAGIFGFGVADNLNIFVRDGTETVEVFAANRGATNALSPSNKFNRMRLLPAGIVALNPEFDYKYVYTSDKFVRELLKYPTQCSYIDVALKNSHDANKTKADLQRLLGDEYEVKTQIELNEVIYKTNKTEKWVTFFILSFILVVATFNLIGSLAMLIIEKRGDIRLLNALGLSQRNVRRLFLTEGLLITGVGLLIGLSIGVSIILLQQHIGFFPLQGGIVEFYPVSLSFNDVIAVAGITLCIGWVASSIPVQVLLRSR